MTEITSLMDVERVHINPVAPDPNASGRYGSLGERSSSGEREHTKEDKPADDRLEISEAARRIFQANVVPPDIDFARKALRRLPDCDGERAAQISDRIESGYYASAGMVDQLAARMIGMD